jgi:hypothetical protein
MKYLFMSSLCVLSIVACNTTQKVVYLDKKNPAIGSYKLTDTTFVEDENGNFKMIITEKKE